MSWSAQRVWSVSVEHFVQPVEHDAALETEVEIRPSTVSGIMWAVSLSADYSFGSLGWLYTTAGTCYHLGQHSGCQADRSPFIDAHDSVSESSFLVKLT